MRARSLDPRNAKLADGELEVLHPPAYQLLYRGTSLSTPLPGEPGSLCVCKSGGLLMR